MKCKVDVESLRKVTAVKQKIACNNKKNSNKLELFFEIKEQQRLLQEHNNRDNVLDIPKQGLILLPFIKTSLQQSLN